MENPGPCWASTGAGLPSSAQGPVSPPGMPPAPLSPQTQANWEGGEHATGDTCPGCLMCGSHRDCPVLADLGPASQPARGLPTSKCTW